MNYFEKHFLSRGKRQLLIWNPKKESTKISGSKWKKVRSRNLAEDCRRDFLTSHFVHSPRRALLCSKIPIKCTVKNKEAEFENFLGCNESTPWYRDVRRRVTPENTWVKLISASPILDLPCSYPHHPFSTFRTHVRITDYRTLVLILKSKPNKDEVGHFEFTSDKEG